MADSPSYPMSYSIKPEKHPVTADELMARRATTGCGWIGTDAVVFISLHGENSVVVGSFDGRTGRPMKEIEKFDVMGMMAGILAKSDDLDPKRKEFAQLVHDTWKKTKP